MRDAGRIAGLLREFARQTGRRRALAVVLATLTAGAAAVSVSWWLKLILDGAAHADLTRVTVFAVVLAVTVALQAAASNLSGLFLAELQFGCGWQVVVRLMEAGSRPPGIEHYERPDLADQIAVMKQQTNFVSGFLPALSEGVALLGRVTLTAVLLAEVHPALLFLPVLAVPSIWAGARAEKVHDAASVASAQAGRLEEHLFRLATTASPAKEVRIFGLGPELVARRDEAWDEVTRTVGRAQLRAGVLRTAGWLPFAAGYLAAVGLVLARAGRGDATPGDVLLVMVLAGQVNGQVAQLLNVVNRSASAVRVIRRFLWLQDYASDAVARSTPEDPALVPATLHTGIDLDHVSFRYAGDDRAEALRDVTLRLRAGTTVAVVGENGAGKTTLVKLLCGFYAPTGGTVTVDGVDLQSFDAAAWRERMSAGFQDFARFELRLRESVGIGSLASLDDPARTSAALGLVGADLGLELDQQLGQQWAGGVDLSEGQWQKVAMARAMMRREPLLLVLDEPTSGLDPHAEHALFDLFAGVAAETASRRGAIALFVSHRFSTVRMADHIVVLAAGRVVDQGDHASLMSRPGLYRELYEIQARAYQ